MGYSLTEEKLQEAFNKFKLLTDRKKEVTDDDFFTILMEIQTEASAVDKYDIESFQIQYGNKNIQTATLVFNIPTYHTDLDACSINCSVAANLTTLYY